MRARAAWKHRAAFAEMAEVLGISTDCIMAAQRQRGGVWVVLYSRTPKEYPPVIFRATLARRQTDGLLQVEAGPTELPGFWEELTKHMDEELPRVMKERGL